MNALSFAFHFARKVVDSDLSPLQVYVLIGVKNGIDSHVDLAKYLDKGSPVAVDMALYKLTRGHYLRRDDAGYYKVTDSGNALLRKLFDAHFNA